MFNSSSIAFIKKTSKSILFFTEAIVVSQVPKCSMGYSSKGNLSNLIDSLKKTQKKFGEYHQTCAELYSNIAFVLSKYGDHQEALMNYQKCLKISQQNYGDNHPAIGSCLNYIGNIMMSLGRTEDAISYYSNALNVYERTESFNEQVSIYSTLAYVYREMQDEKYAINYSKKAMEASKFAHKKKPAMLSMIISNYAETLERFGRDKDALKYYKLAAEAFPLKQNGVGTTVIILFKKIGELQFKLNLLQESLETFLEAQRMISSLSDLKDLPKDYAFRIQYSVATVELRLGILDESLKTFESVRSGLEILGLINPLLIDCYYQQARIYKEQGNSDLAKKKLDEGSQLFKMLPNKGKDFVTKFQSLKSSLK